MSKRIGVFSDPHCGHIVGLTPPGWQLDPKHPTPHLRRIAKYQRAYWEFYCNAIRKHGPFDVAVWNGDCIDGKGTRGGSCEAVTADRNEQVDIAKKAIGRSLSAKTTLLMTYGTPYHTGAEGEDFEYNIAEFFGAKIGGHEYLECEGVTFDFKHKVGSSGVPHGRHTAIAREHLWAQLWAEHSGFPNADVLVRSHVHYYDYAGGRGWLAMTTPALQGLGSNYGTRQCSGTVDFGFVVFTVNKGGYSWEPVLLEVQARRAALRV